MQNLIKNYFTQNIQTQIVMAESLSLTLEKAAKIIVEGLLNGNKILACGNGSSATNVQNFTSRLMTSIEIERPGIPAITLTSDNVLLSPIANRDNIYARQIQTLGQKGDIFVVLTSEGNSKSIIQAVQEAVMNDITIVALTGFDGGQLIALLGENDIEIRIPSHKRSIIYDMHGMVLNCLYELIENMLFIHDK